MFRTTKLYTCMAVVLAVICVIFLSNCGGGGNSSVVPNTNSTTENPVSYTNLTPTPVLSNVNVSGYLYVNNTVTEDGETVPSISVLDVPACQSDSSGNESFLTQFSNSIKADYPEDWAKQDIQELYAQLNKTLSESKPLPEYNAQAQVCSTYDDTYIPVGSDGHFDNTVLTEAADSNVKLEVALGEDNYAEVETLPSSGSINSSDATSAAVLKSCPEKIFAFPGEILIFKVYAEPGINLKSAGLKFTLNNSSIGCITQPVYLCLFGAHKYQVAYGCVYMKPGLDTPVDTTITAKLNSGQSMSIFLEVIKKTASVSGTIYTGGSTLVKGYVKSLGPKACCKIDASGNYTLPKVFRGHSRSVIATWWTSENGQKIRHREEKIIDFFNSNLTGFNFGVPPTPTPTLTPSATPTFPPPTDKYYDHISCAIIDQKLVWQKELGCEQGIQKTVAWLNGQVPVSPVPIEITQAIKEARVDEFDPYTMWFYFKNDFEVSVTDPAPSPDANTPVQKLYNQSSPTIIANIQPTTVKNFDVLMLGPKAFEDRWNKNDAGYNKIFGLSNSIASNFSDKGFNVKCLATLTYRLSDPNMRDYGQSDLPVHPDVEFTLPVQNGLYDHVVWCNVLNPDTIVRPTDFEHMGQYGVIFIDAHGISNGIMACPWYENDVEFTRWIGDNWSDDLKKCKWSLGYAAFPPPYKIGLTNPHQIDFPPTTWPWTAADGRDAIYYKFMVMNENFFSGLLAEDKDFSGSLVLENVCDSWQFQSTAFPNSKVFIGFPGDEPEYGSNLFAYEFLNRMLGLDPNTLSQIPPMSAGDAFKKSSRPPNIQINNQNDNTYLPGSQPSVIVIQKK